MNTALFLDKENTRTQLYGCVMPVARDSEAMEATAGTIAGSGSLTSISTRRELQLINESNTEIRRAELMSKLSLKAAE